MRQLLVFGSKTFKITVPDDAKITFGPWSPPRKNKAGDLEFNRDSEARGGTLRIYAGKTEKLGNLIACFANVSSFRLFPPETLRPPARGRRAAVGAGAMGEPVWVGVGVMENGDGEGIGSG